MFVCFLDIIKYLKIIKKKQSTISAASLMRFHWIMFAISEGFPWVVLSEPGKGSEQPNERGALKMHKAITTPLVKQNTALHRA